MTEIQAKQNAMSSIQFVECDFAEMLAGITYTEWMDGHPKLCAHNMRHFWHWFRSSKATSTTRDIGKHNISQYSAINCLNSNSLEDDEDGTWQEHAT